MLVARMRLRLGRGQGRQPPHARHQEDDGYHRAGLGEPAGRERRGEWRADDEADLVEDRLERVGGVQLGGVAEEGRPAGPDHRADTGHAPGDDGEDEQRPARPALCGGDQQAGHRGGRDQGGGAQYPALAVLVDQPGDLGAHGRGGERDGGGDPAGEGVAAAQLGDHREDTDAHHGQRHPAYEAGGCEPLGAGGREYRAVGTGQGALRKGLDWLTQITSAGEAHARGRRRAGT